MRIRYFRPFLLFVSGNDEVRVEPVLGDVIKVVFEVDNSTLLPPFEHLLQDLEGTRYLLPDGILWRNPPAPPLGQAGDERQCRVPPPSRLASQLGLE